MKTIHIFKFRMKCQQTLCQRTKKISTTGNCDVCQNVIEEIAKKNETTKKNSNFKKVEIDFKLMYETHKKLLNGGQVDPKVVNTLLLGGVVNILIQSEEIEAIEQRINAMEREDLTNKAKIEYLENWVIKQNDAIEEISKKLNEKEVFAKECNAVEKLKKKVDGIENEMSCLKRGNPFTKEIQNPKTEIKCDECGLTFFKTCELELHLEEHEKKKQFKCEICAKEFFLSWRMKKHMKMHSSSPKVCRFFDKNQPCPFEKIGCMFSHLLTDQPQEEDLDENEDFSPKENQCHLCKVELSSKNEMFYHVQREHEDYFQGMMEVMSKPNKPFNN